jgi:hypothetical protein
MDLSSFDYSSPRRSFVDVTYNGVNATGQISPYIKTVQYTDVASGSSDSISLTLNDRDKLWINSWFPEKGDSLQVTLCTENWDLTGAPATLNCGTFCVDDFGFRGGPLRLELKGVALPADTGFKQTDRTKTYEKTNLKEIGDAIAARAGVTLVYEADPVSIEKTEQNGQPDCTFYNDLVQLYGLSLKIFNDKLVVFDEGKYEDKDPIYTLTPENVDPNWSWDTQLTGTYTGVSYSYSNSDKNKVFTVTAGDTSDTSRILTCNEAAENLTEATAIALAAVNKANRSTTTMNVTAIGNLQLFATACVQVAGFGKLDGKYYIQQADHSLGDGYSVSLQLRKVEQRITKVTTQSSTIAEKKKTTKKTTTTTTK